MMQNDKYNNAKQLILRKALYAIICWVLACILALPFMPRLVASAASDGSYYYLTDLQGRVIYSSDPSIVPVTLSGAINVNEFTGYEFHIVEAAGQLSRYNWKVEFIIGGVTINPRPGGSFVSYDSNSSNTEEYKYYNEYGTWKPDAIAALASSNNITLKFTDYEPCEDGSSDWYTAASYSMTVGLKGDSEDDKQEEEPAPKDPPDNGSDLKDNLAPSVSDESVGDESENNPQASINGDGSGSGGSDSTSDVGGESASAEGSGMPKNISPLANAFSNYTQNATSPDVVSDVGEESAGEGQDYETSTSAPISLKDFVAKQLSADALSKSVKTKLPSAGAIYKVASGEAVQSAFDGEGTTEAGGSPASMEVSFVGIPLWLIVWICILVAPLAIGACASSVASYFSNKRTSRLKRV